MMAQTELEKMSAAYGKVVARAWRDPAFKAKLMADPPTALRDAGFDVPASATVQVMEDTDTHRYFILPAKPSGELSDESLDSIAGGTNCGINGRSLCF
jgi:hypothetical protein